MSNKNGTCPICGYDVVKIPKGAGMELRAERLKKNVFAPELAKKIGVSPNYIYMLENGIRKFDHELIHKYQAALKKA